MKYTNKKAEITSAVDLPAASELLSVNNISFHYAETHNAITNITTSFKAGEMVAVLGNNGAGKSTFFLCCNGVLRPQEGTIFYKGQEISSAKKDVLVLRTGVGLVFQDPDTQIIAGKVESEVSFGPMNLRLPEDEVRQRVDEALDKMALEGYRDRAPQYLSGGEKKRVSIADILAMRPSMILLDEPTASLDPKNSVALEQVLNELNQAGITIVISTHDVDFAYRIAQRVIVFSAGHIIADAPSSEVFAQTEILEQAGITKPLLYEVFELMQKKVPELSEISHHEWPRTIESFNAHLNQRGW